MIKKKDRLSSIFMLMPLIIIFSVFFLVPLFYTIYYSFTDWSNYSPEINFTGFFNYKKIVADPIILTGIKNSIVYAVLTVLLQNLISLPVAVLLTSKLPFRNGFRTIFFSPAVLSVLVVGYLWNFILSSSDYGLMNKILSFFGANPINFLGNPKIALLAIIFTQVWQWFGWSMVIYIANLQSIPEELYEAASIDGATKLQQFWNVTLPNLSPSVKINLITGMISGLKVFDIVVSLTKGGPGYSTETIMTLIFSKFSEGNYGNAAAFGVTFLIVSLILTSIIITIFKRWERTLS